jgi:endoglucanase
LEPLPKTIAICNDRNKSRKKGENVAVINIAKTACARAALLAGFLVILQAAVAAAQTAQSPAPQDVALSINEAPKDQWGKNRLTATLADGRLQIADPGSGDFNDATFWQITFNQPLPYGRKIFSFRVDVSANHQPLWGQSLLQPVVNGKEGTPATDDSGKALFEKIVGGDGKGFIPAKSGVYAFALPKTERTLGVFGFMTAGASGFDIKLGDFQVTVWPEEDTRVLTQRPYMSELGYGPQERKTLLVEWWDDQESQAATKAVVEVEGPEGKMIFEAPMPGQASVASESRVSSVDLSALAKPGAYTVTVPSLGKRTQPGKVSFEVVPGLDEAQKLRDQAWGAFYWITDDEHGPYPNAHKQDAAAKVFGDPQTTRDVRGGWFDAGDYGKYSVNGAYSVGLMLLTGMIAPDALQHEIKPLAGGRVDRADWLDVVEAQLRWLIKMQGPDGGVNHKATTRDWPGLNVTPEQDQAVKWLMPVTSTATADFAAVMALAAHIFEGLPSEEDKKLAVSYRAAAEKARGWLAKNPGLVMIEKRYDGFEYGGPYDDTSDADERFFADAAYAVVTKSSDALGNAASRLAERAAALQKANHVIEWGNVDLLGFWALKSASGLLAADAKATIDKTLGDAAAFWLKAKQTSPWGIGKPDESGFEWGSNSIIATTGWHWLLWARAGGDAGYVKEAQDQQHYFFGRNPLRKTYVTGESAWAAKHPHFRPSVSGAIKLPAGFLVGGPNSVNLAGDPTGGSFSAEAPMRRYADDKESYATNEVAINWQATWAVHNSLLLAALGPR